MFDKTFTPPEKNQLGVCITHIDDMIYCSMDDSWGRAFSHSSR